MSHPSTHPPLPTRLLRAVSEQEVAQPPARFRGGRLALRLTVTSFVTVLAVGYPVLSGSGGTSPVPDPVALSPADSPVVMGLDGLGSAAVTAPAPDAAAPPAEEPVETAEPPDAGVEPPGRTPAPEPETAAGSQPAAEAADPSLEGLVLALVNTERAAAGCGALVPDAALAAVARAHSADMRDRGYFAHVTPEGLDPFDRAARAGLTARAENIAYGQPDPSAVMTAWMNSPGHRANILDCDLTQLGVGIAQGDGGPWWTQLFA